MAKQNSTTAADKAYVRAMAKWIKTEIHRINIDEMDIKHTEQILKEKAKLLKMMKADHASSVRRLNSTIATFKKYKQIHNV